jgi:hypothetical protein
MQGKAPEGYVKALQDRFIKIPFAGLLDDIDLAVCDFDPRDHFDNGYIDDGWGFVGNRLETFRSRPLCDSGGIDAFARAAHGIVPKELLDAGDLMYRGGLPHHDEIAVDDEYSRRNGSHRFYEGRENYSRQFEWRKKDAAAHVQAAHSLRS